MSETERSEFPACPKASLSVASQVAEFTYPRFANYLAHKGMFLSRFETVTRAKDVDALVANELRSEHLDRLTGADIVRKERAQSGGEPEEIREFCSCPCDAQYYYLDVLERFAHYSASSGCSYR